MRTLFTMGLVFMIITLCFGLLSSCIYDVQPEENPKPTAEPTPVSNLDEEDCEELDIAALEVGYALGALYDELFKDGDLAFMARFEDWEELAPNDDTTYLLDDYIDLVAAVFEADLEIVDNFYNTVADHKNYVANAGNYNEIVMAIECYAHGYEVFLTDPSEDQVVPRGWFTKLREMLGYDDNGCTYGGIWAHLGDAVVETVLTMGTAGGNRIITGLSAGWAASDVYGYFSYLVKNCVH